MKSKKALSIAISVALMVTLSPVLSGTAYADSSDTAIANVVDSTDTDISTENNQSASNTDNTQADSDSDAIELYSSTSSDDLDIDAEEYVDEGTGSDNDQSDEGEAGSNTGESTDTDDSESAAVTLEKPTISSISITTSGVVIKWSSVDNATGYCVQRKSSSSSTWTSVANDVTGTSYTDNSVPTSTTSTTYTYAVYAYADSGNIVSEQATKSLSVLATASLTSVTHTSSSVVKLTWGKVSGASKYYVYRKVSGGSWSKVKTTTSTSYSDSGLTNGKQYYYWIWAYSSTKKSIFNTSGVSVRKLSNPKLGSAVNASGGIKVTWSKVTGATGYIVYRKKSGGSWKKIGTSSSTSYTDKSSLTSGTKYVYTVRAYHKSSGLTNKSWYNTSGVSERKLSIPSLKSAVNSSTGIKVTWKKVTGAKKYYVYRKKSGGSWKKIKTTTSTSYTDKSSLSSGTKYVYTVRAVNGSDTSYYKTSGVSETKLSIPSLKTAKKTSSGVTVAWKKVTGATGYIVYRKKSGGSWKRLKKTTSTSYTDKSTTSTKYYYTVRAYKGSDTSYYKTSGISVSTTTVAVTKSGSKYHVSSGDCPSLSRSKSLTKMTRAKAEKAGYDACKNCDP